MAILRYPRLADLSSSFYEIERMRREMDRLFSGLMGRESYRMSSGVYPSLNISEDGEKFYVEAELPGTRPEDLDISVEGNTLTLKGERKGEDLKNASYHRRERKLGSFQKAVALSADVNSEAVSAEFKNGVLKLVLPKAEHAKPRKIAVKYE